MNRAATPVSSASTNALRSRGGFKDNKQQITRPYPRFGPLLDAASDAELCSSVLPTEKEVDLRDDVGGRHRVHQPPGDAHRVNDPPEPTSTDAREGRLNAEENKARAQARSHVQEELL